MNSEIWIVDDEPGILTMCSDYLSDDYRVRTFASALELLACIKRDVKPDLVLSDIKMPELDGLQLAESLRGLRPQLPVLMMSGYADKSHILTALAKGVSGFIEKPFNPKQMKQVIDETIGKKHYIQSLEHLAVKYNSLATAVFDLNQEYIARSAAAENQLFNLNLPDHSCLEEAKETIAGIKRANDLHYAVKVRTKEIEEILTREQSMRERLALIPPSVLMLRRPKSQAA